ncbi:hypothetical protein J6E39_00420 [bacterium]|nr:hypothetical protein [bacterium]
MDNISDKKTYTNFEMFYYTGYKIAEDIKSKTTGMLASERVDFARKCIIKDVMNTCINIGILSKDAVNVLESSNNVLKFSIDNLVKNLITHSDIKFEDYLKIPLIAKNPTKIVKSKTNYDVMLFKCNEKYYKLVIKTTKNRKENFIKSFHIIKLERYEKY